MSNEDGQQVTGRQRRLARRLLKCGSARTWRDACERVRAEHPDVSGDVERQLVRSLERARGLRLVRA
jgi:ribosomal protein L19E